MDLHSPEYRDWYSHHQYKCQKNFDGRSNAMEAEAAALMWERSVRTRGIEYGTMLCDGDSKAFQAANKACGYTKPIVKEDCVNHIAKRMFNALDNLKKTDKSKFNYKLTKPNIEKITNTYASNLKQNAPDPEAMNNGVLVGFFRMISTDDCPNHKYCPEGESSDARQLEKNQDRIGQPSLGKWCPSFSQQSSVLQTLIC